MFILPSTTNYFFVKNLFFKYVYFSEYDSQILFICFLVEKQAIFITYVHSLRNGERSSKMCTSAHKGRRIEKSVINMYVPNGWSPKNVDYFLCLRSANCTRASLPARKMSLFSSIIVMITLSYAIIRI